MQQTVGRPVHAQVTWNVNIPPTPAWRSINNVSKLHRTLTSPPTPPHPNVQRSISNMMKDQVHMNVIAPPHPTHPNVQRSMSNVMKPQNTVKTKGKRRWCKKTRARKREKHCKNQCKWTKAENITRRNSCSCPPRPPPGQHCREAENTKKKTVQNAQSAVCLRVNTPSEGTTTSTGPATSSTSSSVNLKLNIVEPAKMVILIRPLIENNLLQQHEPAQDLTSHMVSTCLLVPKN